MIRVLASIVAYHSEKTLVSALRSLLEQSNSTADLELKIIVTDNTNTAAIPEEIPVELISELTNKGFAAPNNRAAKRALNEGFDYLLLLNPDCAIAPGALQSMIEVLELDKSSGVCCPKLLRADEALNPIVPPTIDGVGIYFSTSLRHFDRGGGEIDRGQYDRPEYVFGASGACMLISTRLLKDLAVQLAAQGGTSSSLLFDELFFAYREDADLAWRMNLLGWKTRYEPSAVGYHVRKVTHTNRSDQPAEINAYGVRNRFLLLANNWEPFALRRTIIPTALRNVVIRAGVYLRERSSIPALRSAAALLPVAARTRRVRLGSARVRSSDLERWFCDQPYSEPALTVRSDSESSDFRPTVHVIVINYRSEGRLASCLAALESIKPSAYSLKISIVDNSPEAGLASSKTSDGSFNYQHCPENLGFAGAINRISNASPSDFLLTLNPDVTLTSEALLELVRSCVAHPEIDALAPVLTDSDGTPQFGFTVKRLPTFVSSCIELFGLRGRGFRAERALRYEDDPLLRNYLFGLSPAEADQPPHYKLGNPIPVEQPAAACLLIRTSALNELGGFDEQFYPAWFEDVDLCKRLRDRGKLVGILNSARVIHEGGYTIKSLGRKRVSALYFKNMGRYWAKHGGFFAAQAIKGCSTVRSLFQ